MTTPGYRLRFSSSRQPYRRGGLKIGPKHTPTVIEREGVEPAGLLAILRDPVITVALSGISDDGVEEWHTPKGWERAEAADQLEAAIAAQALAESEEAGKIAAELLAPVEPPALVEPVAPEGAEPKAASGRQPRPRAPANRAAAKAGTKQG